MGVEKRSMTSPVTVFGRETGIDFQVKLESLKNGRARFQRVRGTFGVNPHRHATTGDCCTANISNGLVRVVACEDGCDQEDHLRGGLGRMRPGSLRPDGTARKQARRRPLQHCVGSTGGRPDGR